MKRQLIGGASALALLLAGACAPPAPEGPTDTELIAAADALDDLFIAALNAGDAAAMTALYAADAVSYPPDAIVAEGITAIEASYAKMAMEMPGAEFELIDRHQIVAGDVVIGHGQWRMTMTGPDGEPLQMEGRYTDAKAERDGKWVYLVDHASVPIPPPPSDEMQ